MEKIIVIGADNYNTCGIIRSLGEAKLGFEAIIVKSKHVMASKSKYLKGKNVVICETAEDVVTILLQKKKKLSDKAFLVVEGDHITGCLDLAYDLLIDSYIWNNCGEQGKLTKYLDKYTQVTIAKQCGINVLNSVVVETGGEIPDNIDYPIITKAITSEIESWKSEVFICNNEAELREACKKIKSSKIMLQKYVNKTNEVTFDGFSIDNGKQQFIAIKSKYKYLLPDRYSYYLTAENCNDPVIEKQICDFMTLAGYEGIYCFEFIVDETGKLYFLESNFRNSGWSYAATCAGMPLPVLWIESMKTMRIDPNYRVEIPNDFTFMNDFADFRTRVLGHMTSIFSWIKEFISCNCKLDIGRKDPMPAICYFWSHLIRR